MTTNKPVELGRASDETKQMGLGTGDNPINPHFEVGA
jgi:hypothetical protein